ncbi:MAG: Asp-tRNA(Asn)/Glu-tRNA(Gln) amidotransferase subunit GatB [Planctomycetota bacterium]|jgi:aspartyl-tRNA(Asn)/glutamyl-tRNA(Gln) amidotransferase subunit B
MPTIADTRLTIGMEVHVELATRTKMFSRSANVAHPDHYDAAPNTLVDPVNAGLPGALPVMNRRAIEMSIMVGLALHCRIAAVSRWDRKNYFYPDLPKGYQISQYQLPLCEDGFLEIPLPDGGARRVGVIRAHLEEDAGKLGHELPGGRPYDGSLVDLNRAGTPLLEIVSAPDLVSAEEAVTYGKELRTICRFLGVSEGIMQRGHMRFEPNINVIIRTDDGVEHATPVVEIKNLNSFRSLQGAVEHERERQVEAWKADGLEMGPGMKSTRGWDDVRGATFLQRSKEDAHDYRYFPDPDLVPVTVSDAWRERISGAIPELPMTRRARYRAAYGLDAADAVALTEEADLCLFYEACVAAARPAGATPEAEGHAGRQCAKWLLNAGARLANERGVAVDALGIDPPQLADLVALRDEDAIGSSAADRLFALLCDTDDDARAVADAHGLLQVKDEGRLAEWIGAAVEAQPGAAADFAAGKDAAAGRLIGEVMKRSGGQADAKLVRAALVEKLRD